MKRTVMALSLDIHKDFHKAYNLAFSLQNVENVTLMMLIDLNAISSLPLTVNHFWVELPLHLLEWNILTHLVSFIKFFSPILQLTLFILRKTLVSP